MQSVNRFIPDAANALRAADAAAITADTLISAGELKTPLGAIWDAETKDGKVVFFFKASAMDATTGDETYTIEVISSATSNLASPAVHLAKVIDDAAPGWYSILVDQQQIVDEQPTHKYYGLNVNVAGTSPSITLEVYLLPPTGV